ncbi:MAG: DUF1501 domain-containing protein [Woeseia sp.]|nr:DUF1501 domain-containing protein [Woeseia sp.]
MHRRKFLRDSIASATALSASGFGLGLLQSRLAIAQSAEQNYKALVFLFLNGGNDANNMIAPTGGALRTRYETGRGSIALPAQELHPISVAEPVQLSDGNVQSDFGFHPSCEQLAQLFDAGHLNVVCNSGNLITPVDRQAYIDGTVALPPYLYSHADQQRQLQSEPSNPFRYGWGGRMAELLAGYNTDPMVSSLITLSGLNAFQVSRDGLLSPYGLSNDGALALQGFSQLRSTMVEAAMSAASAGDELLGQKYADVFRSARTAEVIVRAAFDEAAANGIDYDAIFQAAGGTNSRTQRRLKTVAKMIAGKSSMTNQRPVFFVSMEGFDTHQSLLAPHAALLSDLDASIKGFHDSLVEQGDFDSVVTMVGSEFGRTFTPNGNSSTAGSDHGWGGHTVFMGGAVNGSRLLGTHPDFRLNEGLDTGRGRWIPTTSNSQCAAQLARWMDVPEAELQAIFPSTVNFTGAPAPEIFA